MLLSNRRSLLETDVEPGTCHFFPTSCGKDVSDPFVLLFELDEIRLIRKHCVSVDQRDIERILPRRETRTDRTGGEVIAIGDIRLPGLEILRDIMGDPLPPVIVPEAVEPQRGIGKGSGAADRYVDDHHLVRMVEALIGRHIHDMRIDRVCHCQKSQHYQSYRSHNQNDNQDLFPHTIMFGVSCHKMLWRRHVSEGQFPTPAIGSR